MSTADPYDEHLPEPNDPDVPAPADPDVIPGTVDPEDV